MNVASPLRQDSQPCRPDPKANAGPTADPGKASGDPLGTRDKLRAFDAAAALLEVRGLSIRFGGVLALSELSFDIAPHSIVGLIGPNGAGKTTVFNCLTRLYQPSSGDIRFEGRSLLAVPAHRLAARGVCRSFQNLALFQGMTVLDNVRVGAHTRRLGDSRSGPKSSFLSDMLGTPGKRRREAAIDAIVWPLLERLGLHTEAMRCVGELSFGIQKRVELARALAAQPKLLLLDEPAGGLNHGDVHALGDLIRQIRDEWQVTVLLVEHHMGLVMGIADRVVAINFGRKIAEGTPLEIQQDEEVIAAYLGPGKARP